MAISEEELLAGFMTEEQENQVSSWERYIDHQLKIRYMGKPFTVGVSKDTFPRLLYLVAKRFERAGWQVVINEDERTLMLTGKTENQDLFSGYEEKENKMSGRLFSS